ncbi:MAG: hypothetical protein AAFX03_11660 [Pseudomonadota bacterium]
MMARWLVAASAFALAGCGEVRTPAERETHAPPPSPPPPPPAAAEPAQVEPQSLKAEIDWDAAREDFASRADRNDDTFTAQSADASDIAVPILLPTGVVTAQSADGGGPRFMQLPDGYFAAYPGPRYDIVVNGTNEMPTVEGKPRTRNEDAVFTATAAGAQVALSRYGADYLIEFECKELNPRTNTCIEADEALEIAENLVVAGSR